MGLEKSNNALRESNITAKLLQNVKGLTSNSSDAVLAYIFNIFVITSMTTHVGKFCKKTKWEEEAYQSNSETIFTPITILYVFKL